jgi:hypothetical protein
MNKPQTRVFLPKRNFAVGFQEEPEAGSVELTPNVTAELNAKGELIGIENYRRKRFSPRYHLGFCAGQNASFAQSRIRLVEFYPARLTSLIFWGVKGL